MVGSNGQYQVYRQANGQFRQAQENGLDRLNALIDRVVRFAQRTYSLLILKLYAPLAITLCFIDFLFGFLARSRPSLDWIGISSSTDQLHSLFEVIDYPQPETPSARTGPQRRTTTAETNLNRF